MAPALQKVRQIAEATPHERGIGALRWLHTKPPLNLTIFLNMKQARRAAVLSVGSTLPATIRTNDDPTFAWLREHQPAGSDLFKGLERRRVLCAPQTVEDLVHDACSQALHNGHVAPQDIDLIMGAASVSDWVAPNGLALVHQTLGLPAHCRVLPLNSDYTTYLDALKLAHDLVTCGTARHVLVASGNNWTQHVDYHEAVALAAGDGAGAALVGPSRRDSDWHIVDWANDTQTSWYGAFRMAQRPCPDGHWSTPLMTLDAHTGQTAFKEFGLKVVPQVALALLKRHGIAAADITLLTHQSSLVVQQAWQEAIQPGHYPSTLAEYGDMVSSSVAVNLAHVWHDIPTRHVVLLGVGMEMHATAVLLSRQ